MDYVTVTATVTAPWGEATTVELGSIEAWAHADARHWQMWRRDRRRIALDAVGTSGGPGWRVAFTATPDPVEGLTCS